MKKKEKSQNQKYHRLYGDPGIDGQTGEEIRKFGLALAVYDTDYLIQRLNLSSSAEDQQITSTPQKGKNIFKEMYDREKTKSN